MHPHYIEILHHLGRLLLQLYSHHHCCSLHLTKVGFQTYLLNCVSAYWKIDYKQMPSKRLIYRAFRENFCSQATFEKLAMYYYAKVDKANSEKIISEYLLIANRQRIELTPYFDRFVEEYEKKHKPRAPKRLPLRPLLSTLKKLPKNDLKKVVEEGKRLMREKGKE